MSDPHLKMRAGSVLLSSSDCNGKSIKAYSGIIGKG